MFLDVSCQKQVLLNSALIDFVPNNAHACGFVVFTVETNSYQ